MMVERVGIVHPGAMGIFVAASILNSGYEVCWASEGRSSDSMKRAEQFQLSAVGDLASLCRESDVLVSVCPPHAALKMAEQVVNCCFKGIYLDVNAISPQKAKKIGELMQQVGNDFIDGGIVGGPDWEKGGTRLYLSGSKAEEVQRFFTSGPLQTASLGEEVGRALVFKMCYAAYTKGTSALLANTLALAESHQVREELAARWEEDWPGLYDASKVRIERAAAKAWRFEGEMQEIAETFYEAGLPGDFHLAASQIYMRLGDFKNQSEISDFVSILKKLLSSK